MWQLTGSFFRNVCKWVCRLLCRLGQGVGLLTGLRWSAPGWLRRIGHVLASGARNMRAHPRRGTAVMLSVLIAGAGAWVGWDWYRNLPQPQTVAYRVGTPALTDYRQDSPVPDSLRIRFTSSVAPLPAIGAEVDAGLSISPAIEGAWHWANGRQLVFTPQSDWEIGQRYRVRMDDEGLLAEGILLEIYDFEFQAPTFRGNVVRQELFQDPIDTDRRMLLVHLDFTHPVDEASLRERLEISFGPGLQYQDPTQDNTPQISLDEYGVMAYVQSAPLAMPLESVGVRVDIAEGVAPRTGGRSGAKAMGAQIAVPGRYQLGVNPAHVQFVDDAHGEPEPVLMFESTRAVADSAIAGHVSAWLLPEKEPAWQQRDLDEALLKQAELVELTHVPSVAPLNTLHAFQFDAPPGRQVYVRVSKGVEGIGGYLSRDAAGTLLRMPNYPKVMRFLSEGAVLGLGGEQRLGFMARGVTGVQIEVARLLPEQLHHLVDQNTGTLARPGIAERYFDRLVERETQEILLPGQDPAKAHYDHIDLKPYLRHDGGRKGIFVVRLSDAEVPLRQTFVQGRTAGDTRFVIATDLGIIAKGQAEGGQDVFVQSIATGQPVAEADVQIVGRNGLPVAQGRTNDKGHAHFPDLGQLVREKAPLMVLVSMGDDMSFLPLVRQEQRLDFSRFDVGGVRGQNLQARLDAYLFTDRGLYRPGETAHLGMIVRRSDWQGVLEGLPVELIVTDPRGMVVQRSPFALSADGFETQEFTSAQTAPAGTYLANLELIGRQQRVVLGSASFSVRAFEPDRMKVDLVLHDAQPAGWLLPEQVQAMVTARHLFGAPAGGRRVSSELTLSPAFAQFAAYPGYRFHIQDGLRELSHEELADVETDEEGQAQPALDLSRFTASAYQLLLMSQVFESEGGRSVAAEQRALVADTPWLVGVRAKDSLDFIPSGVQRTVHWQGVSPDLSPTVVSGLFTRVVEHRYVSVLVKQSDGNYRYESQVKEVERDAEPLALPLTGAEQVLDTGVPGEFSLALEDASGKRLNQVRYTVAGQGNVSRSLERNAELQLQLDKRSYAPGEDIAVSIRAPYVGAGLITIERDKVYTHQWFSTDATSSVQTIRLPEGLEGNAYVNVQFLRDPGSSEVYMSPLSYGVASFAIDLDARRLPLTLDVPEQVEPGDVLTISLETARPGKAVVYAVDEGILQVARYDTPDPLAFFFRKRALEVDTRQILDLILPEFSLLIQAAAPGGDTEAERASHLNPFKRKRQPPVAWWSGLLSLPEGETRLQYHVPEYFNGRLRLIAVMADDNGIGVVEDQTNVRGALVLTPNVPAFVAPGDEVLVTAGIYSNLDQSADIRYRLETGDGLQVIESEGVLSLSPNSEGNAAFTVRAGERLGAVDLRWVAVLPDGREISIGDNISVRASSPYRASLQVGRFTAGRHELKPQRDLHEELGRRELDLAASPLAWARGLRPVLESGEYAMTGQQIAQAMPALVLSETTAQGQNAVSTVVTMLRQRQDSSGGFGRWAINLEPSPYDSLYAVDFLLDAIDRGYDVPSDLMDSAADYLTALAHGPAEGLWELRGRAHAAYLLTRQGVVASRALADIHEQLQNYYPEDWVHDLAAAYLGAAYQLLKQDALAGKLFAEVPWLSGNASTPKALGSAQALRHDAQRLWLMIRHFPAQSGRVPDAILDALGEQLGRRHDAMSAAWMLRALDAYGAALESTLTLSAVAQVDGAEAPLVFQGRPPHAVVPFAASAVTLAKQGSGAAFYALGEIGFDRARADSPIHDGLEITRDFLNLSGAPLKNLHVGDEFLVRLRLRLVDRHDVQEVAVIELLPAGIEPVPRMMPQEQGEGEYDGGGEQQDGSHALLGERGHGDWPVVFADLRDDRIVLYGTLAGDVATFVYRARATNAGQVVTPAPYVQGIDVPELQGRGVDASLRILPAALAQDSDDGAALP